MMKKRKSLPPMKVLPLFLVLFLVFLMVAPAQAAPMAQATPVNDNLANALVINSVPYTNNSIRNRFATMEPNEATPTCGGSQTRSVWWSYTPVVDGVLKVDTIGSNYDTALSIWTGAGHPLTEAACDDDGVGNLRSTISMPLMGGIQYYIRVAGYNTSFGNITLNVDYSTNPPINDDLTNAIVINTTSYTNSSINNHFATMEPNEVTPMSPCINVSSTQSVWWAYTPSGNGILNVDTIGSNFDTVLSVWTGTSHPLTEAACDDDGGGNLQSSISMPLTGGTTYFIRVAGYRIDFGDITLNASFIPSTFVWDGGGSDDNWSTPENWVSDTVPGAADTIQFNATSVTPSIVDSGFVGATIANIIIDSTYTGNISIDNPLAVTGNYFQDGGTVIVNPAISFTVNGNLFHTNGVLRETTTVNSNSTVNFLQIETSGGSVVYRGVDVTTTTSDLGSTTVSIKAVNTGIGEYCTSTEAASPNYAERCYEITPTTDGSATVRLWALTSELNSVTESNLAIYRNNPAGSSTWVELSNNATTGNDGSSYSYAEADTPGFSHFLLGDTSNTPTAVTLQSFSATHQSTNMGALIIGIFVLALGSLWLKRRYIR